MTKLEKGITIYSKDIGCDTKENLITLIKREKFVRMEIVAQTAGGYRVEVEY